MKKIVLIFDPNQAPFIKSQPWHQSQKIISDSKKEFKIELTVIPSYELKAQILSYGATVEVLKPSHLREEMIETIKNLSLSIKKILPEYWVNKCA